MTVQRDVNPENDKKLDQMLEKKFGNQNRSIVTGDAIRVLKSLAKHVIKARKQFEDYSFNPPLPPKVAKSEVDKHGSHDQSSHTPIGNRPGGYKPGAISEREHTSYKKREGRRLLSRTSNWARVIFCSKLPSFSKLSFLSEISILTNRILESLLGILRQISSQVG